MISKNVVILTKDELERLKLEWYDKGVARGRFLERSEMIEQAKAAASRSSKPG